MIPERRKADRERHAIRLRENWYRDLWLLAITIVLVIIALNAADSASDAVSKVDRQREGRAVAVDVVCGATSAIINAGRATLTGGNVGPPEFVRALEDLGFPPKRDRVAAAHRAADAYAKSIAVAVEEQSGVKGLVRSDGTLNCSKLRAAAATK